MGVCLVSCAPTPAALTVQGLDALQTRTLLDAFGPQLQSMHITLKNTSGHQYTGTDPAAFKQVVANFYQTHPGFCPIEEAFFMSETLSGVYMTVTSNNQNVAVLIYDQRKNPLLSYVIAEGQAEPALPSSKCSNQPR